MRAWALAGVAAVALAAAPVPAQAAQTSIQTAAVTPSYANPATGVIEDSGGAANQALGESMTASCVFDQALVERAADGRLYATMRFRLIDQISAVSVDVSGDGGATFAAADVQEMQRDVSHGDGSQDNVGDYRFEIPAADAVVRVHLDVVPMGRAVVCFAALGAATEGNPNGFVESVVAGEDIAGSDAAATGATDAAAAGAEAAADASGTEGSGEVPAASDIQEYDADGNRVDAEGPARLSGGTVALVVAAAVGLLAVGAGVFWLVRVRPARAAAARAAAAAAPDSAAVPAGDSGSAAVPAGGSGLVAGPGSAQTGISTGLTPSPEESTSAQRPFPPAASSSVPAQDAAPDGVPDADPTPTSTSDSELEGSPTGSTPSPTGSPTGLTPSPNCRGA